VHFLNIVKEEASKSIIAHHLIKPLIEAQYKCVINFYTAISMPAVADQAELESKLLILTTNLTPEELLNTMGSERMKG